MPRSKMKNYFRQAFVSLVSAKLHNPHCEVMLISNLEIPPEYLSLFQDFHISIKTLPYDKMILQENYPKKVFFYKWNVLYHLTRTKMYQNILCIDMDTYVAEELGDLWNDCQEGVLLYHVRHRHSHKQTSAIRKAHLELFGTHSHITSYGGEFIASNTPLLADFLDNFQKICELMVEKDFKGPHGDELVIDFTALLYKEKIIEAGAYINRYWTKSFHLVSTNWYYDQVDIWHLPAEKQFGFNSMFYYILIHKKLPKKERAARMFSLPRKSSKLIVRLKGGLLYLVNLFKGLFFPQY